MTADAAARAADQAARQSYGRLIAYLSARSRNIAAAEDALAEAFRAALEHWPASGIPASPAAWLLTAARRAMGKTVRHARLAAAREPELIIAVEEALDMAEQADGFGDERLKLMFVCAHPAIDPAAQTPLMLQTVLGLDAARIAAAFLEKPATMGQRLVRAKQRIRDTGIRFAVPDVDERPERLEAVLQAIYAAFTAGWDDGGSLSGEAIWLGRVLLTLMPEEPEVMGLLSLMLALEARRPARRNAEGFVPLDQQDVALWDGTMMAESEELLRQASAMNRFGRFQCEAAIQAVHGARRFTGETDIEALRTLYAALVKLSPTVGARVGQAAVSEPREGLRLLAEIPEEVSASYQPFHAVKADLLRQLGRGPEAAQAYARAVELSPDPAVRQFLWSRMAKQA